MLSKIFGALEGHATSHKLSQAAVDYIDSMIGKPTPGFHVQCYPLSHPGQFGLENDLYGPSCGDDDQVAETHETRYFFRGGEKINRDGTTPITSQPPRPATSLVVIWAYKIGPWCETPVLITMYGHGGDAASPMEPWDRNLKTAEQKAEAIEFWSTHAISRDCLEMK